MATQLTDVRARRVVARPFADVPTAAELDAKEGELRAVRQSRNGLVIWIVLLALLFLASLAGIAAMRMGLIPDGSDTAATSTPLGTADTANFERRGRVLIATGDELNELVDEINRIRAAINAPGDDIAQVNLDGESAAAPTLATEVRSIATYAERRMEEIEEETAERDARFDNISRQFLSYRPLATVDEEVRDVRTTIQALIDSVQDVHSAEFNRDLETALANFRNEEPLGWTARQQQDLEEYRATLVSACRAIEQWVPDPRVGPLGEEIPQTGPGEAEGVPDCPAR